MEFNRPNSLSFIPPIVLNLIIINTIMWFASSIIFPRFGVDLTNILGMHFWVDDSFNVSQFLSYMFMHDTSSFGHLFFNMFGIFMFGADIERMWGWKKFSMFYLISGIGAGLCQQLAWMVDFSPYLSAFNAAIEAGSFDALSSLRNVDASQFAITDILTLKNNYFQKVITVGASGSLFGLLLAFGWLFPERKIMLLFFPVPIPARIFVGIYAGVELVLGVSNFSMDNIAHFAHLGGMIFGGLLLFLWKKTGRLYGKGDI